MKEKIILAIVLTLSVSFSLSLSYIAYKRIVLYFHEEYSHDECKSVGEAWIEIRELIYDKEGKEIHKVSRTNVHPIESFKCGDEQ